MTRRLILSAAALSLCLISSLARAERYTARKTLQDKLLYGIDTAMEKDLQLHRLMTNLGTIGFKYTGQRSAAQGLLAGTKPAEGDCGTLVALFALTAKSKLGIDTRNGAYQPSFGKGLWVNPVKIVDPARGEGNVDNGKGWFFTEHYWCTYNGKVFDVLFMKEYASIQEHKKSYTEIPYSKDSQGTSFTVEGKKYVTNPDGDKASPKNRYVPTK